MPGGLTWFEDFEVGHVGESPPVEADRDEMVAYARAHDPWPIHLDEEFAAQTPHGGLIASFGYVVGLFFRAAHQLPMNQGSQEGFINDDVKVVVKITSLFRTRPQET